MKNGIYEISNDEYHSSLGISRSGLTKIIDAPIYYKAAYIDKKGSIQTNAMIIGNALHTKVLEPELFNSQYYCLSKIDRRTTDGKAEYAKALAMSNGKTLIKSEDMDLIEVLSYSIKNNNDAIGLMENTLHEKSLYWTDDETGILCKARPDFMFLSERISYVGDIKTTKNASPFNFQKDMFNYGYHIQAAMIAEGLKQIKGIIVEDFYYVVVEKAEPYVTAIYKINSEALEHGHKKFREGLTLLKKCQETNEWPSYPIQDLGLPSYAYYN